ncbi:MAG: hypothetical protein JWN95_1256 [Frankiales bacterium]|nr:hypothetical protein [Frankiales bacterium]
MKIRGSADTLRVSMQGSESALLTVLFDDFLALIEAEDEDDYRDDPVTQRLYPDGYSDDEAASAEYRELVAAGLRDQRRTRLKLCREEVTSGSAKIELDPEGGERWIAVLNDLRLALGTRLGVTEETELAESQPAQVYHWLTAVQDMFIEHLMH